MDVQTGITPRSLTKAMIEQRFMVPEDTDAVDRLFHYLETAKPTMGEIKQAICEFYVVRRQEIERPGRKSFIVFARHVFCYFSHKYCGASLHQIRRQIGYCDHTSVWHAIRRVEQLAVTRPLIRDDLDLLRLRICEKLLQRKGHRQ